MNIRTLKTKLRYDRWRRWPDLARAYLVHKLKPRVRFTEINYDTTLRTWMHYFQGNVVLGRIHWMGVPALKNPLDLWMYQELIWRVKPEVIVEIGSFCGGSTLFLAHLLDMIGAGEVISLDISRQYWQVNHPRITLVTGDSTAPETIAEVTKRVAGRRALMIHDGDHAADTVLQDLRAYSPLVSVDSYFIVEDGIVDTLKTETAIRPWFGPLHAIQEFLAEAPHFQVDRSCERYMITYNPSGYLKRII